ncbi:hypothetical protein JL720_13789 [Aureococcus anophagefferens]|nr:hypothetical protein JL720_13789 [Aureococcus anophagefferens]
MVGLLRPALVAAWAAASSEWRCALEPATPGAASACGSLDLAGMEASGSTLAYQLLAGVVALANESAPRGVTVAKHHKSAPGDRDPACAALTYRDPRDVVCSHAGAAGPAERRRARCSGGGARAPRPRRRGAHVPYQAKRLDAFRDAGALLLRYEDFADCPAALAALFALRVFGKVDAASQIHGHHISADGATGSWRTCLTDAALRHVEDRADRRWLARHRYAPATQPRR